MPEISGVGDGAFGMTTAGRSIVNAYSNGSRTVVAAQAPGALAPVEALARVALAGERPFGPKIRSARSNTDQLCE
jgi:hypothetical protein